jgi:hypothetical protein
MRRVQRLQLGGGQVVGDVKHGGTPLGQDRPNPAVSQHNLIKFRDALPGR